MTDDSAHIWLYGKPLHKEEQSTQNLKDKQS